MMDTCVPGAFVKVYTHDGGAWCVSAEDEGSIDAAVEQWLSSGETRDTLLHMAQTDGDRLCLRASRISGWMLSTVDGRRRSAEISKAYDDEAKANRREAGYIGDE